LRIYDENVKKFQYRVNNAYENAPYEINYEISQIKSFYPIFEIVKGRNHFGKRKDKSFLSQSRAQFSQKNVRIKRKIYEIKSQ
jgi:hypothetical protein